MGGLAFDIMMGLRKGLKLVRGMRRSMTEEEQKRVSGGDVLTTVPMHPGDIARSLLKKIIKDVGLTEEEFRKLL